MILFLGKILNFVFNQFTNDFIYSNKKKIIKLAKTICFS